LFPLFFASFFPPFRFVSFVIFVKVALPTMLYAKSLSCYIICHDSASSLRATDLRSSFRSKSGIVVIVWYRLISIPLYQRNNYIAMQLRKCITKWSIHYCRDVWTSLPA
jgi:hypothetical protein